ncbi:MAG: LPS export ABC transporter permease LptF [Pseudomonadota bacterium]
MSSLAGRIDRYILRAVLTPLLITLTIAIMLLFLEQMLRLFEFVIDANGPIAVVWRMLGNLVPKYLSLALPIGFFLGILLAFRRLSLSSELDAMAASGVSLKRLLRPIVALSGALVAANFLLVAYVEPYSEYRYSQIKFDVRNGALGAKINVGEFIAISDEVTLRIGGLSESESGEARELRDVFVESCDERRICQAIAAERGVFLAANDENSAILRLYDGRQLELNPNRLRPRALQFNVWDFEVELPGADVFRERGDKTDESTIGELWSILSDPESVDEERYWETRANFHWRVLHTLLILALPLLAIPMGIADRRRDSGVGVVVGLAMVILYYEMLEAFEAVVADQMVSPWLIMWPVFFVFLAISLYLFRIVSERPGVRALAPIEAGWEQLRHSLVELFRTMRRAET